mmetsp:Transcript_20474/g.28581  ORF Transcript_20474/g.28581 Transcript_20474/m.28581 type:complete len:445 (+) Transcript_20474:183-1517(+)
MAVCLSNMMASRRIGVFRAVGILSTLSAFFLTQARPPSTAPLGCKALQRNFGAKVGIHSLKPRPYRPKISRSVVLQGQVAYRRGSSAGAGVSTGDSEDSGLVDVEIFAPRSSHPNFRNLTAEVHIDANPSIVWKLLTDYEHLDKIVPNLAENRVLDRWEGGARLLQVGEQRLIQKGSSLPGINFLAPQLTFRARCVLECNEHPVLATPGAGEINFDMVKGDFEEFRGSWIVKDLSADHSSDHTTLLRYNLGVRPSSWIPVSVIEHRITSDVTSNLNAIRNAAQRIKELEIKKPSVDSSSQQQARGGGTAALGRNGDAPGLRVARKSATGDDFGLMPVDIAPPGVIPRLLTRTTIGRVVGKIYVPVPSFLVPSFIANNNRRWKDVKRHGLRRVGSDDFFTWLSVNDVVGVRAYSQVTTPVPQKSEGGIQQQSESAHTGTENSHEI